MRALQLIVAAFLCLFLLASFAGGELPRGGVVVLRIQGTINPATADYLDSGLRHAAAGDAKLVIVELNTPGGLLPSMQLMVEALLQSKVPTAVYVTPQGGGAMSAGMFLTLAGNFAVMAPGTNIGAAHPILNGGQSLTGDMAQKVENFAASLAKSIAEQRGRNVKWAEESVRESVAATASEAKSEGVIDFIAGDRDYLLTELEGKTVNAGGRTVTLTGLRDAPPEVVEMSTKQVVLNYLADPNIAMLLGMGALLGIAVELYHPGGFAPGIFGAVCLVLSLIAGQILPISVGGVVLMLLGAAFCIAEAFVPSFGALGIVGTICVAVGAFYAIDEQQVFSESGFEVNKKAIVVAAIIVGSCLAFVGSLVYRTRKRKATTGREGLVGKDAVVLVEFAMTSPSQPLSGKVRVMGEIWRARLEHGGRTLERGEVVTVVSVGEDLSLLVKHK